MLAVPFIVVISASADYSDEMEKYLITRACITFDNAVEIDYDYLLRNGKENQTLSHTLLFLRTHKH